MTKATIFGVLLKQRVDASPKFQEVIAKHGCNIKTRIGIHTASEDKCSPNGVILLDVIGSDEEIQTLENDIRNIPGAEVQKMYFENV